VSKLGDEDREYYVMIDAKGVPYSLKEDEFEVING
jgi:hypothetical protein